MWTRVRDVLSVALALVALWWVTSRIDVGEMWSQVRGARPGWLLAGAVVFWSSLPLRGYRWRLLYREQGHQVGILPLTSAILQAWTINCALPGRAGDLYSAFLVKASHGISAASSLGTILSARVLDLLTLIPLVSVLFLWTARGGAVPVGDSVLYGALGIGLALVLGLLFLRRTSGVARRFLPDRFFLAYGRFVEAAYPGRGRLPALVVSTLALWALECARLWCVLGALDSPRPLLQVAFFALVAAIVTTLPLTPGGLGGVELFYQQALPLLGMTTIEATSAAFLDRFLNYWLILLIGGPLTLSQRARARSVAAPAGGPPPDDSAQDRP